MIPHSPLPTPHSLPIAIVGASTRSAAASAVRAGLQPITADLFADADLHRIATATRISPYPEGLLDWLRTMQPSAWMYTGALENYPELVDQMAWIAPLWGNPGDVLARVRSPRELALTLSQAGLLFPETRESADGLPNDGSWLAKSYAGASGSGVRVFEERGRQGEGERGRLDGSTFTGASPPLPISPSPTPYFQRRIPGTPAAAVFVAADGIATLLGVSRQLIGEEWLGAHGFQYAGSIGPLPISEAALSSLKAIGNTLAERFEILGLFGVDFILAGDDVWTLEVNPRYTASVEIIERMTGVHAIALHAAACSGIPSTANRVVPDPVSARDSAQDRGRGRSGSLSHGKATLFARSDVTITPTFAEWSLAEASRTPWPVLADVSAAGTLIDAGRPVLTIFAQGTTADEIESHLRQLVAEIEPKLYARS